MARWNLVQYLIKQFDLSSTAAWGVILGGFLLCMIVPYLLGSLNFGLIISRKQYHDDVREHGSGNAGTTNMLRTYGKKAAVLTLLGDMLKAVVAVMFGYFVLNFDMQTTNQAGEIIRVSDPIGASLAGLFVMIGHMFPCFFKFKGGKGVATAGMVVLMISPLTFVVCFSIFAIIVIGTKYVSLGSIMGMLLYPLILRAFLPSAPTASIFAVIMAVMVVVKHKENIKRLLAGQESKISLGKKKKEAATATVVEAPTESEQDYQFVTCVGCGRLIPQSRKACAYCKAENPHFLPDPEAPAKGKKKAYNNKRKKK